MYRDILDDNLLHFSTVQRLQAHSQEHKVVPLWALCECLWVAKPELRLETTLTSLERSENSYTSTPPIKPDGAWEVLQRRMREIAPKQPRLYSSIILKKTLDCNCNAAEVFLYPSQELCHNTILSRRQFLGIYGLVCAQTCTVNYGMLYRQLFTFNKFFKIFKEGFFHFVIMGYCM